MNVLQILNSRIMNVLRKCKKVLVEANVCTRLVELSN